MSDWFWIVLLVILSPVLITAGFIILQALFLALAALCIGINNAVRKARGWRR